MTGSSAAWALARAAADRAGVSLVALERLEDARAITGVVEAVWGGDVLPSELIRAFQHAGSVLYGARAGHRCVGFVLGFAGLSEGLHLHSHMLAVVPEWQDRGVGYALKLAQRAACLDHGIAEVRWTYDPLVARNARFNLVKLGAVGTAYLPGFYGPMRDRLNRGDRSDRFEVRWPLHSARVGRALADGLSPPREGPVLLEVEGEPDRPRPRATGEGPEPGARVAVPPDYHALKAADPPLARRWRECAAEVFRSCFGAGLVARWISRQGVYVFDRPEEGG